MTDHTTLRIKASQLRRLVEPVLPFTDSDRWGLPALESVLFRSHGGHLYAHATDRYRLGVQRVPVEVADGLTFCLSAKSIRAILALYKGTKTHNPDLEVTVEETRLRVTGAGSLGFSADSFTSWDLMTSEYPKIGSILLEAAKRAAEGVEPTAVNAGYLGDYKMAAQHDPDITPIQVWPHRTRPNFIRIGRDFVGALMPVRYSDDGDQGPGLDEDWTVILGGGMTTGTVLVETIEPAEDDAAVPA